MLVRSPRILVPWFAVLLLGPGCAELGYFSLKELKDVKVAFGLGIERDIFFEPTLITELIENAAWPQSR